MNPPRCILGTLFLCLTFLLLTGCPEKVVDTRALVLVNSESPGFPDFRNFIEPYLWNFGVPYTVLDIASAHVTSDVEAFAVILIGHKQIDVQGDCLDPSEHEAIAAAVRSGTGLINFDNDLADEEDMGRYPFVQDLFGFEYGQPRTGSTVAFLLPGSVFLPCWDDNAQDPVLATTTDASDLVGTDGLWTEFHYVSGGRPFPSIFAGVDEEDYGLPVMRFYAQDVPAGEYEIIANLYTCCTGNNLRYYYGFTEETPTAHFVDTAGGTGGPDQHEEYSLGTREILDGVFEIFVKDADLMSGSYPFFGWAWIRLVPVDGSGEEAHYITARHQTGEWIDTGEMTLAGIADSGHATALATSLSQPFLAVTLPGEGRAVQWGSTGWMSHTVKGPVSGLDDLVWRSIVWAARKPFVMQCLPPFVTLRVDDVSGPFWWVDIANDYGLTPWMGVFLHDMDEDESAHLSSLAAEGKATASVHAFTASDFFYFNHGTAEDWPDALLASHFEEATQWHLTYDIPISCFVLPHYYEIGTNAFQGLLDWDVEFVGTMMEPGSAYVWDTPWLTVGPYRNYETPQSCRDVRPVFYADFITIPGHPELDGRFFNCATEIRDDAGYEWYPSSHVEESIGRGVRQTLRALDSKVLATLFTHEQNIQPILPNDWMDIMAGVVAELEPHGPIYVSQDHAVGYVRALHTSTLEQGLYTQQSLHLVLTFTGKADRTTVVYLFLDSGNEISETAIDVPAFEGSIQVEQDLSTLR